MVYGCRVEEDCFWVVRVGWEWCLVYGGVLVLGMIYGGYWFWVFVYFCYYEIVIGYWRCVGSCLVEKYGLYLFGYCVGFWLEK